MMEISLEQYNKMAERLTELEYKEAERQWIPCSERFPEYHDEYLVTFKMAYNGKEFCGMDLVEYYPHEIYMGDGEFDIEPEWCFYPNEDREVIAWMPLPEPYKEEQE